MNKLNKFTLISLNVRGLRERAKRKNIFEWCKIKGGDVIFLQETYSTKDVEETWRTEWGGPILFSHGTNHSRGSIILISPKLKLKVGQVDVDEEGRYILFNAETQGINLVFGNVYFPTRDKEQLQFRFLEKLDTLLSKKLIPKCSIILGGDFNSILDYKLDYLGPRIVLNDKFSDTLKEFLGKYSLQDIWRKRNPDEKQFTFRQKSPVVESRLDYWFVSLGLGNLVDTCDILTSIAPDHSGIRLKFNQLKDEFKYGKSYWKFNNSLCEDKVFVDTMKDKIKEFKDESMPLFSDKRLLWDFMKMKMREFTIIFSRKKARVRRAEIEKLEKEINDLETQLLLASSKTNLVEQIENKKSALKILYEYSRQGIRVRSRAQWFEEGENNTQYFEQLSQSNKRKSVIRELYKGKGDITKDKNEILKTIKSFYEKLYSKGKRNVKNKINFFQNIRKLNKENSESCEGKVTNEECYKILKEMKFNKSPGNDGFTVEFYITFWPQLGEMLVETLNETYEKKELSNSQKQGVITLLEKEGKNALYVKNYRPISLLNVDYKILSKVLASRIKKILGEIISNDQVGYIKERNIGEAVRIIDDLFFHSQNNSLGFLIAVDFEKAFDSVDHDFLFEVLTLFGFGNMFCNWVKILYTDVSSCVMNGGNSTGYFGIKRGVRQGDPLSPYLFLLAIEILANTIRNDSTIKGFQVGEYEIKQVLYADDFTLFMKDRNSIDKVQYVFEEFEKLSGLKVNKEKTNCVWIGKENEIPQEHLIFGNIINEVKILGIIFTRNIKRKEELNYKEILSKIKRLLGWWKERDLSLMGKVHLLKTYALSKLNYVSSLIVVPKWVISEVEKMSFDFLWNGKDRVKRNIICQTYADGGIKMSNFTIYIKAQRIMWLKRLIYGENKISWKLYFDYCCRSVGGRFIFLCDYETSKMNLEIPTFYLEIMYAWQDLRKCRFPENESRNPIIFNNRNICWKGKMFCINSLYKKGIYLVNHIMEKGKILSVEHFKNTGVNHIELLMITDIFRGIPAGWKEQTSLVEFQEVDTVTFNLNIKLFNQKILFQNAKSRQIYEYFINELKHLYTLKVTDCHTSFVLSDKELKETFNRLRSTTLINKHREFQFKLLHGVAYTKEHLLKFSFVANNLCSFCQQDVESYIHVFLNCVKVKEMWLEAIQHFDLIEIKELVWTDIFLGIAGNSSRIKLVNTLIIFLKYIVYHARKKGAVPTIANIKKLVLEYKEEEKKLATKRGKLGMHLLKWEHVY